MLQPVRRAIVAAIGGVAIASVAAGWGLWLSWGATGWPGLDAWAQGVDPRDALLFCANLMLVGGSLATLAPGLLPTTAVPPAEAAPAGPVGRRTALGLQLGVGALLLACILPYAVGAPAWSPFAMVRSVAPDWGLLAVGSLIATLSGGQCLRRALRAPTATAAGI
ncbi:hypothetical protein [Albimonas pacifica]|uniref:Uncharacterized protein n=1 Tax=Albimonas pacifica TaxID=1114924 RepID=A0A1I3FEZ9_9RHOB|nr:hypothetical protein [Albimonas pacifica]SFI09747.1 hypothetical protein SAMN05216258_104241 [Albimonas pacifica]